MRAKRVLVFGTFDGLHPGHLFFLRSAKAQGDTLVVGVARDLHVQELKGKRPSRSEDKRLAAVQALAFVEAARLCDAQLGTYTILEEMKPDLIVLGHDQQTLEKDLLNWMSRAQQYFPMSRIKKL
ncbi:adenylyltransferase/cytidyltransferase family protein [Candidatus Uhrbacteria bacterium]|nr:adenylyltransferase/cytidyltransferase family protein [Candidatus Uhrbacteria bacterium]